MRGTSQRSLSAVWTGFLPVLDAAGDDASVIGEQLFAVLDALDSSKALVRGLADPARPGDSKAALVRQLLGAGFDQRVVDVVAGLVAERWTADADLAEAVEHLAVAAMLVSARSRGQLQVVEDELFTIMRSLLGSREARSAISAPGVTVDDRLRLLDSVLAGRGDAVTQRLARRATSHPRGRRFVAALTWYSDIAAGLRDRLVALVTASQPFSEAQLDRLGRLLAQSYGKEVQLNFTVDPAVLGGLRIQVGDDIVDATVLSRMTDARRRMAS